VPHFFKTLSCLHEKSIARPNWGMRWQLRAIHEIGMMDFPNNNQPTSNVPTYPQGRRKVTRRRPIDNVKAEIQDVDLSARRWEMEGLFHPTTCARRANRLLHTGVYEDVDFSGQQANLPLHIEPEPRQEQLYRSGRLPSFLLSDNSFPSFHLTPLAKYSIYPVAKPRDFTLLFLRFILWPSRRI